MKKILFILLTGISIAGCKQDFTNPGAISSDNAFTSLRTLAGTAVGLQNVYTNGRLSQLYTVITASGALTNEFRLLNAGNTDEANLFIGGSAVDNLNGIAGNMWIQSNKIIFDADNVINAASSQADTTFSPGLIAYASIYKALAIGNLCMFFEQIPAAPGTGTIPATFQTRIDGYKRAVSTLQTAQNALKRSALSPFFFANVPSAVNANFLNNTINALIARYSLFAGDYATAITASNAVNANFSGCIMQFDGVTPNPIFSVVTTANNIYQIQDSTLGLPAAIAPDLNDRRIPFYTTINTTVAPRYRINGFFNGNFTSIPIYLPSEMRLIRAESYLRQSTPNIANALIEINAIRQKTPSSDPFGIGAGGTAYTGPVDVASLLTEVYRQRCIELCMSGMRLEDSRRLGRPVAERKRNFFPYPSRERDNNPNTPADPAF